MAADSDRGHCGHRVVSRSWRVGVQVRLNGWQQLEFTGAVFQSCVEVIVNGENLNVEGDTVCRAGNGKIFIAVGDTATVALADGNPPLVVTALVGTLEVQPCEAKATKNGNTYKITGKAKASFLDDSAEPFDIDAICP